MSESINNNNNNLDEQIAAQTDSENPIVEALKIFSSLSDEEISIVGENILNYGFDYPSYKNLTKNFSTDLSGNKATKLMLFLKYVSENIDTDKDIEQFDTSLKDFLNYHNVENEIIDDKSQKLGEKLSRVFNNPQQSVTWYETSIIDNLLDINGIVDVRPVFHKGKISKMIPMIVFRVALSKDYESPRIFVFQVTKDEFVEKLEGLFQTIQEQLSVVEENINQEHSTDLLELEG